MKEGETIVRIEHQGKYATLTTKTEIKCSPSEEPPVPIKATISDKQVQTLLKDLEVSESEDEDVSCTSASPFSSKINTLNKGLDDLLKDLKAKETTNE